MSSSASNNNGNNPLSKLKNRFSKFSSGANDGLSSNDAGQAPAKTPDASIPSATSEAQAPSPKATAAPEASDVGLAATSTEPLPMPKPENKPTKTSSAGAATPASTASGPPPPPGKDDTPPSAAASAHLPNYSSSARSLQGEKTKLRHFYPQVEPYRTGRIKVGSEEDGGHELYWELSGKEGGHPIVYLHGGPGGGISPDDRRWFDPAHYQILTFDQRGAGQSTPPAELKGNTTWDLVQDIETLRTEVAKVDKWHVFGGSWGSTLSLAYAQKHPERVTALILRGIFTLRRSELLFFYQNGTSHIWPEQFRPYLEYIPENERHDMISAYYKRLTSSDEQQRLEAARRWSTWENATSKLYLDHKHMAKGDDDQWALQFARIESHFFSYGGWMEDGHLLKPESVARIAHIPTIVVQGRYDGVCPAVTAWDLREAWLKAPGGDKTLEFFMVPDAGHSAKEPGIADKLLYATDKFRAIRG